MTSVQTAAQLSCRAKTLQEARELQRSWTGYVFVMLPDRPLCPVVRLEFLMCNFAAQNVRVERSLAGLIDPHGWRDGSVEHTDWTWNI